MNDNYLIHFGNKNSGRYRRGSGENPHQHDGYGKVGRELSKDEAIKISKNIENKYDKATTLEAQKIREDLLNKKYKGSNWKKKESSMDFFYENKYIDWDAAMKADKKVVDGYLNKYGEKNLNNILSKAGLKYVKDVPKDRYVKRIQKQEPKDYKGLKKVDYKLGRFMGIYSK